MIGIGQNLSVSAAYLHTSGASLEYDFTLGTLAPISGREAITFTRSTVATAINAIGQVETLAINQPRFDHDPNTIAQQNLLTYSEQFDNAAWTKNNMSITANSIIAPNGVVSADTLTATAGSSNKAMYQGYTATAEPYTFSVYAKAGTASWVGISLDIISTAHAYFNLSTGVVGTVAAGVSAAMRHVGNGWYLCSVTRTMTAAGYGVEVVVHTADNQNYGWTAVGTETMYIWGAQATLATGLGSPELVSNGTFESTNGWIVGASTGTAVITAPSGQFLVDNNGSATYGRAALPMVTVVGRTYVVRGNFLGGNGKIFASTSTSDGGEIASAIASSGSAHFIFVAVGTTTYVGCQAQSGSTSATAYFDNISIKELNYLPYTPTTSAAATVKYACKGLLIEEARENLASYAEELDNAAWTKSNQTVTANSVSGPTGATIADTVTASAGSGSKHLNKGFAATAVAYTGSVYAKAGTTDWLGLAISGNTALDDGAFFNLATGVVGTVQSGTTATMESVGNGWYRCSITRTLSASTRFILMEVHTADAQATTYTAAGTETLYLWGVQVELGAFATSYIPTTTAAVTRAADLALITNVTPWYNSTDGTLYIESSQAQTADSSSRLLAALSTDISNYIALYTSSGEPYAAVSTGGASQVSQTGAVLSSSVNRSVLAYQSNNVNSAFNGTANSTDTSATIPSVAKLLIGNLDGLTFAPSCHIRKLAYYPRRIPDAELEMLTA